MIFIFTLFALRFRHSLCHFDAFRHYDTRLPIMLMMLMLFVVAIAAADTLYA